VRAGRDAPALGREIATAVRALGLRIRTARLISAFAGAAGRVVWCLDLEGGRRIKARLLEDHHTAAALCALRAVLPSDFAPVVARSGRVLFEEWIDGVDLARSRPGPRCLGDAARLLAGLHATPTVAGRAIRATRRTTPWRRDGEDRLRLLRDAGLLSVAHANVLRRVLAAHDPYRTRTGLTHSDLCGENLVRDRAGRLRVIDNERLGLRPFGYDLARTRYRWGLDQEAWSAFLAAYSRRHPATARRASPFWDVVVATESAMIRRRVGGRGVAAPIAALARIVHAEQARRSERRRRRP
jgi:aminoglycoside phosphotransferase (APT) family kinase protein